MAFITTYKIKVETTQIVDCTKRCFICNETIDSLKFKFETYKNVEERKSFHFSKCMPTVKWCI